MCLWAFSILPSQFFQIDRPPIIRPTKYGNLGFPPIFSPPIISPFTVLNEVGSRSETYRIRWEILVATFRCLLKSSSSLSGLCSLSSIKLFSIAHCCYCCCTVGRKQRICRRTELVAYFIFPSNIELNRFRNTETLSIVFGGLSTLGEFKNLRIPSQPISINSCIRYIIDLKWTNMMPEYHFQQYIYHPAVTAAGSGGLPPPRPPVNSKPKPKPKTMESG